MPFIRLTAVDLKPIWIATEAIQSIAYTEPVDEVAFGAKTQLRLGAYIQMVREYPAEVVRIVLGYSGKLPAELAIPAPSPGEA